MQPKAANQAAHRPTREKKWSRRPYDLKASAEKVAAPRQKFAPRVLAPSSDSPSRAARAPSESDVAANAHNPLRTRQDFRERSLPPALRLAERLSSCLHR